MQIDLDHIGSIIADASAEVILSKDIARFLPVNDEKLQIIDHYLTGPNDVKEDMTAFCLMQAGYWFYKFRDYQQNFNRRIVGDNI